MAKDTLTIRIDEKLLHRIEAVAEKLGETRSEVAERMLSNEIDGMEESVEMFDNVVVRELVGGLLRSPKLVSILATLVGKEVTPERTAAFIKRMNRVKDNSRQKHKAGVQSPIPGKNNELGATR